SSQYPSSQQPSSGAPPDQSQTATGAQAGEQTIDGCIIKKSTTFFIQPSGGPPTKLSESPDVASHEGQHVVVHGSQQRSSASGAGTNPSAAGQPSGSSGEQTFNVTRVDTVATNCPAEMKGDTSNPK